MGIEVRLASFLVGSSLLWIDCLGNLVKLRPAAFSYVETVLLSSSFDFDAMNNKRRNYLLRLLKTGKGQLWLTQNVEHSLMPQKWGFEAFEPAMN